MHWSQFWYKHKKFKCQVQKQIKSHLKWCSLWTKAVASTTCVWFLRYVCACCVYYLPLEDLHMVKSLFLLLSLQTSDIEIASFWNYIWKSLSVPGNAIKIHSNFSPRNHNRHFRLKNSLSEIVLFLTSFYSIYLNDPQNWFYNIW